MARVTLDIGKSDEVEPEGNEDADIALVGEAPGDTEVNRGRPFVGTSGRLLNSFLDSVGIKRHRCWVTNVVKRKVEDNDMNNMYKDSNKRHPDEELKAYRREVREEIKRVDPNVVVPLGSEALKTFMHDNEASIHNWRGSIIPTEYGKLVPTFHPAYILRVYTDHPIVIFDLRRARNEAQSPEVDLPDRKLKTEPSKAEVMSFLDLCERSTHLSFDLETMHNNEAGWFIDTIGLAPSADLGMAIPLTYPNGEPYWSLKDEIEIRERIADVMSAWHIKKIAQNAQYDTVFLEWEDIPVNGLWFDTMNAANVLHPEFPKGLDFLVSIYTREPFYKDEMDENRWRYNAKDATCTYEVAMEMKDDMEEFGVLDFYFGEEEDYFGGHVHPLIRTFIEVQKFGVNIDDEVYNEVKNRLSNEIEEKQEKLLEITGRDELNANPSNSLREYLYEDLGAKKRYTDKGNLKTDEKTLKTIHRNAKGKDKKALDLILDLRKIRGDNSRYIKAERSDDGRIRTAYQVSGTETGRLSSRKAVNGKGMNLQNVDKEYRDMFVPDEGFCFLGADLAQAENRVVAYLCQDQNMIDVINTGEYKVHTMNAAMIFDVDPEEVTDRQYSLGKRITHGSNYRMGPRKLASIAGVPVSKAKELMKKYHNTYPRVKEWHKEIEEKIRQDRTLTNPFGRKRKFNDRMDHSIFREATAFIPQSTVADVVHRATQGLYKRLPHPSRIIMNLHDELFLQVLDTEEHVEYCSKVMKEELERPFEIKGEELSIPIDVEKAYNWKDAS